MFQLKLSRKSPSVSPTCITSRASPSEVTGYVLKNRKCMIEIFAGLSSESKYLWPLGWLVHMADSCDNKLGWDLHLSSIFWARGFWEDLKIGLMSHLHIRCLMCGRRVVWANDFHFPEQPVEDKDRNNNLPERQSLILWRLLHIVSHVVSEGWKREREKTMKSSSETILFLLFCSASLN